MPCELGRALIATGALAPEVLGRAVLDSVQDRVPLARTLLAMGAVTPAQLEVALAAVEGGALRRVAPDRTLAARLPPGLCEAFDAVPIGYDVGSGIVDVAVVDPLEMHVADEMGYWLGARVRLQRAEMSAVTDALDALGGPRSGPPSLRAPSEFEMPIPLTRRSGATRELEAPTSPILPPPGSGPGQRSEPPASAPAVETFGERGFEEHPAVPPGLREVPPLASADEARTPDIVPLIEAIREGGEREQVLDLVIFGVRSVARRVALMAVRRDAYVGWNCSPEFGRAEDWRRVAVPVFAPTILAAAVANERVIGPIPTDAVHAPLLAVMGRASARVAVSAVRVHGRAALLILADELDGGTASLQRIVQLARAAGEGLGRLVHRLP